MESQNALKDSEWFQKLCDPTKRNQKLLKKLRKFVENVVGLLDEDIQDFSTLMSSLNLNKSLDIDIMLCVLEFFEECLSQEDMNEICGWPNSSKRRTYSLTKGGLIEKRDSYSIMIAARFLKAEVPFKYMQLLVEATQILQRKKQSLNIRLMLLNVCDQIKTLMGIGCNGFMNRIKTSPFTPGARDALREIFFTDVTGVLAMAFLQTLNLLFSKHDDALTSQYFQRFIDRVHFILKSILPKHKPDETFEMQARLFIFQHCELLSDNCEGFDEFAGGYFRNLFGYKWEKIVLNKCGRCGEQEEEENRFQCCGRCKMIFYCSRECQKKHWKKHKAQCASSKKEK